MPKKIRPSPLFQRIQQVTGVQDQHELARYLGKSDTSISKALARGKLPRDYVSEIARRTNAHPEWLRTGLGRMWDEGGPKVSGLPERLREAVELGMRLGETEQAILELCARVLSANHPDIAQQVASWFPLLQELIARRPEPRIIPKGMKAANERRLLPHECPPAAVNPPPSES